MNASKDERTPTQEAHGIVAAQAWAFLDAGQPESDCGCDPTCKRCAAIRKAIERIAASHYAKDGTQ